MAAVLTSPIPSLALPLSSSCFPLTYRSRPSLLNPVRLPPPIHLGRLRSAFLVRFGFHPGFFPDPDGLESLGKLEDVYRRAEGVLYIIADAAVSNSEIIGNPTDATTKQKGDWLSGITYSMETVLKVLKNGLSAMHVPYAYGFAIILLTILVKAATFPLAKKQVESAMAMRSLQPQIKAIQQRYAEDQERIQLETARLYKLAGINPFAGCLPTLATIPVWIGLYRALSNVADEGLLTEGFFWIPSLAGPTTIAARQNGSGISWLFPFVDGHPPLGWSDTFAYLVLPVSLVVLQYISIQIMQSSQRDDPNVKSSQAITNFLPLMIGYFSLSVPSGLSLYWLTNNILSSIQQVWLQKLGGAKIPVNLLNDDIIGKDPPCILKSASKSSSTQPTQPKAKQEEKLTPEGLHPGERFKQIKAQEALRRQLKEEKRKDEETKVNGSQNGGLGEGANSPEGVNGSTVDGADMVDKKYVTTTRDPSASISSIERTDGPAYSEVFGSYEHQSHGEREQIKLKNERAKI